MDRKKLVIGILAHVDAGKTTLAESMLYLSGSIRKAGRVDHGDTFLDTDSQERTRGITIFSKQALFSWKKMDVTLLDTPGHVDFSAEMERTLQVLDYAVLVISGTDGVQGHVITLWKLLERYGIPVFLFVNKMDRPDVDRVSLMQELRERFGEQCIDFTTDKNDTDAACGNEVSAGGETEYNSFLENIAVCDEEILEKFLERGKIDTEDIAALTAKRTIFPCYFGSALKMEGIDTLLDGIMRYSLSAAYPDGFGARVYKIARDEAGNRLTFMKVTGGCLKVKDTICGGDAWEEKIDQIRLYSGVKYTLEKEAPAGTVCVVTGLSQTFAGEGLGTTKGSMAPSLVPVMAYRILLPPDADRHVMYKKLCELEEEEPQLHIVWQEQIGEIHAQLMGDVQVEILKKLIENRFGIVVEFDAGSILYKETIRTTVEGIGHFEPLRHYAEVHLLLEPGERGSGLVFDSSCSEDILDKNWQRLVLTHLEEREHPGVLTGSPITDMKITLAAGRAHLKHTEGGDFRQATYRAVRQGLHKAECVLLEPVYEFRLELPAALIGRAMSDIQARHGRFDAPVTEGDVSILTGTAPVATMQGYQTEVMAYSGGRGRLFCSLKGYEPCHNQAEVIEAAGYDAARDLDNPASSVFCAHGAGFIVDWDEVEHYMHIESIFGKKKDAAESEYSGKAQQTAWNGNRPNKSIDEEESRAPGAISGQRRSSVSGMEADKELEAIFNRTYGNNGKEKKKWGAQKVIPAQRSHGQDKETTGNPHKEAPPNPAREYLLVDGYNIIFAWEELSGLAKSNLDSARGKLMDILSNYQGYRKMTLILVFDAYKVKGSPGSVQKYHNIHVVYTKEAETADQYIEKATHDLGRKHQVTVATSDGLEQLIIMGQGAGRLSARELKEEIMSTNQELRELFLDKTAGERQYLFDKLPEELAEHLEEVRMGKKEFSSQVEKGAGL